MGPSKLAEHLNARGFKVVICGGPTTMEKLLAEAIIARCDFSQGENEIQNLVAQTSLKQLLAVLKLAHLVVAPDTGPAHMAVTVETPVVGLYAHSNPKRTGPYLYPQYVVSAYETAVLSQYKQSVEHLPWGTRAKGKDLMMQISIGEVKQAIERVIDDNYRELL